MIPQPFRFRQLLGFLGGVLHEPLGSRVHHPAFQEQAVAAELSVSQEPIPFDACVEDDVVFQPSGTTSGANVDAADAAWLGADSRLQAMETIVAAMIAAMIRRFTR